jgi:D-3-phosphoglycerate dehydrogenase
MKLAVTAPYDEAKLNELKARFGEIVYMPYIKTGRVMDDDMTKEFLKEHNPEGLICELDMVSKEALEKSNLKFVGVCRAAPVNVDISAASELGIPVITTPARNAQAVAELLTGGLLVFLRRLSDASVWLKGENWKKPADAYLKFQGVELAEKSVGFVGFGAVARAAAKILSEGFSCDVHYYDPYVNINNFKKCELEELFSSCDIVSLHLPVIPETKGMINEKLLSLMKETAIFINTSRSYVMDTKCLFALLKARKIQGAILDVFDHEPPGDEENEIIKLDNVFATPHIGGATKDVIRHQSEIMNARLEAYFERKDISVLFNGAQLKK